MKLDKKKAFGTVYGRTSNGVRYQQYGLDFNAAGECITKNPETLEAAKALINNVHGVEEVSGDPEIREVVSLIETVADKGALVGAAKILVASMRTGGPEALSMLTTIADGANLAEVLANMVATSAPEIDPEAPLMTIVPVRYTNVGKNKFDVYGSDGSVIRKNTSKTKAMAMVPHQVGDENLAFLPLSDIRERLVERGGNLGEDESHETLITKIKALPDDLVA